MEGYDLFFIIHHHSPCIMHHHSHSVGVTKAFYVKIFSLMDARKAKLKTDDLCGLKMPGGWNRNALHSFEGEDPPLPTGRKSTNSRKRPGRISWCEQDELALIKAVHVQNSTKFPTRHQWIPLCAELQDRLRTKRTPDQLKDKYRNLEKAKSKESLFTKALQF